jgi:hypothetical protein
VFQKTDNPYQFKYLITGITGNGIPEVYLPPLPPEDQIHFKKENKFIRPEPSADLKQWMKEMVSKRSEADRNGNLTQPNWQHPHQSEIEAWEDQESERCINGFWFWNKGVATHITGFYYWMLTAWHPYFGRPSYRETDKEITYWIKFWEEDPNSYGGALNTIRRYGKSSIMGAWIVYRTTTAFNHTAGMQGETDKKIASFYRKMVLKPFYKLPYYHQPKYNLDSKQASKIEFDIPPRRSQARSQMQSEEMEVLESIIDFRPSGEGEYDGEILHSFLVEEPGKKVKGSLYDEDGEGLWDIVKPCFLQGGEDIIGKCLMGTTVENLKVTDRGGLAYKNLYYDSDYNHREEDGRTTSGLYAAFLPGDCAMFKYVDEWGHPMRKEAMASLMTTRKSYQKKPSKLAGWIRKYPVSVKEIFYINPDSCEFNSAVIQDRIMDIDTAPVSITETIDFYWEGNKRDTKVMWRHAPGVGMCQIAKGVGFRDIIPNNIEEGPFDHERNTRTWRPKNKNFAMGSDPIEHGVVTQPGRSSKPTIFVKSKYDSAIDGTYDQELLEKRAEEKFPYQTNRYILMFDKRPSDPNKFFEYAIMICVYFGVPLHVENQKYAIINYFHARGYGDFILNKYKPEHAKLERTPTDGTPASQPIIQEYTSELSHWIEYFGHTFPFREAYEDCLRFKPSNTKEHDYTVGMGFTELACKMKPKINTQERKDIGTFMPRYDRFGNIVRSS